MNTIAARIFPAESSAHAAQEWRSRHASQTETYTEGTGWFPQAICLLRVSHIVTSCPACIHSWTLPKCGPIWNPHAMWCPWCGERITVGVVTPEASCTTQRAGDGGPRCCVLRWAKVDGMLPK
jgi:hypothetical protein